MKISTATLKNLDFKKLAVDHGEKVVVGLIALFVLFALFGTRWLPYSRSPEELVAMTETARDKVEKRDWPAEERENLKEKERVVDKAKEMLEPVQSMPFAYRAPMWSPLFPPKQKNGEPKWLPPEHAIATPGRVPLFVSPPTPHLDPAAATAAKTAAANEGENSIPAEFRKRADNTGKSGLARRPGRSGGISIGGGGDEDDKAAVKAADDRRLEAYKAAEQQKRDQKGRSRRNRKDDNVAAGRAGEGKTQGRRFVSVRAIIPINRQYMMLAKAFHEPIAEQLEATLTLLDFELQRQKVKSDGTWGDWEPVDISIAKELLADSGGFDAEIVSPAVTDPTVTMPLPPADAMGEWGKDVASHKDIENFELTEEEIDAYVEIQEKVMAAKEEQEKNKPKVETPTDEPLKGGFNSLQWNEKKVLKEMAKNVAEATKTTGTTEADKSRDALIEDIKKKVKVEGQLILFRYLDFGVEPGLAYRYRVRVVYNNPNYNLGLDRVADPAYASGQFRPTDWSVPTEPVVVPLDSREFLASIASASTGKEPVAMIDMFQWHPDAGTTINSVLATKLGQFVGGKTKAPLLRPAENSFEDTEVTFSSNEALVDVLENPKLNYEEHPDLGFTKPLRGGRIDITNQALLVDQNGEFVVLDPVSTAADRATAKQLLDYQQAPFLELLNGSRQEAADEKARKADGKKGIAVANPDDDKQQKRKNRRRNSSMKNPSSARNAGSTKMQNPKPRAK